MTTDMEKASMVDLPIGIAVCKVRASRRLTQKQVADRMGCKRTYISKVENGVASPALEQFVRICDAMQVEPVESASVHLQAKSSNRVIPITWL
jgi:transcriptional regulator with XRE-family HTH domain